MVRVCVCVRVCECVYACASVCVSVCVRMYAHAPHQWEATDIKTMRQERTSGVEQLRESPCEWKKVNDRGAVVAGEVGTSWIGEGFTSHCKGVGILF